MVIFCLYWLFRHVFGLIVLRCRSEAANEVEILERGPGWLRSWSGGDHRDARGVHLCFAIVSGSPPCRSR
jgi:hypothetical protein